MAKQAPARQLEPEEIPEEPTEQIPEPAPRISFADLPGITAPGEATSWRIERIAGLSSEKMTVTSDGVTHNEFPISALGAEGIRRTWGVGEYRVTWCQRTAARVLILGNPVPIFIAPIPKEPKPTASTSPVLPGTAAAAAVPFHAPASGVGVAAEGYTYFERFTERFLQVMQLADERAERHAAMYREREALQHERALALMGAILSNSQALTQQQMQAAQQAHEAHLARANALNEQTVATLSSVVSQQAEVLKTIADGDAEEAEAPPEPEPPAPVTPESPAAPPPTAAAQEADTLGKMADVGNAVGSAFEKFGNAIGQVNDLAKAAKDLFPGASPPADAHGGKVIDAVPA